MSNPFCMKVKGCSQPKGHGGPCAFVPLFGDQPPTVFTDSGEAYRTSVAVREALTDATHALCAELCKTNNSLACVVDGLLKEWRDTNFPAGLAPPPKRSQTIFRRETPNT